MDISLEWKIVVGQKKIYQWTPHGRRRRGRPQQEPSDGVREKQKHGRRYGRG